MPIFKLGTFASCDPNFKIVESLGETHYNSFGTADCDTAAEDDTAAEQLTSVCYTMCSMRGSALGGKGARLTATNSGEKAGCLYSLDCHNFMPTGLSEPRWRTSVYDGSMTRLHKIMTVQ